MASNRRVEWAGTGGVFWLKWMVGSSIGWIASFALSFVAIGMLVELVFGDPETLGEGSAMFSIALTAVFFLSFAGAGGVQSLLLRRKLGGIGWWAPASALGGLVIGALYFVLTGVVGEAANEIIHNGMAGFVVGLLQWRILRNQVTHARLWIPATVIGFILAGGGAAILRAITGMDDGTSSIFGIAALFALTGGVMVWLLRQTTQSSRTTSLSPEPAREGITGN